MTQNVETLHRFAVAVVAAVAVSVSLAGNVPDTKDLNTASTNQIIGPKTVHRPDKIIFVSEMPHGSHNTVGVGLLDSKMVGLLEAISIPKKIATTVVKFVVDKVKSVGVKKLLKTAILGTLATGLGAVAAAALAGLASVVSVVCTVAPYLTSIFAIFSGKGHGHRQSDHQSHMDAVSNYAYGAYNQYDPHYNA